MTTAPDGNYPLTAGDSVVATIVDTDDVTLEVVTPDAGSVTVELSSTTDSVVVDPSGTFATITAGDVEGTDNTATFTATVGGIPSSPAVVTYDVVGAAAPDQTSLTVTLGTESAPAANGTEVPEGFRLNEATGQLDHI